MKGACSGCGKEHGTDQFLGYNVRLGKVTEAVCLKCAMFYLDYTKKEQHRPGWFSLVLQRIVYDKNLTRADNVARITGRRSR